MALDILKSSPRVILHPNEKKGFDLDDRGIELQTGKGTHVGMLFVRGNEIILANLKTKKEITIPMTTGIVIPGGIKILDFFDPADKSMISLLAQLSIEVLQSPVQGKAKVEIGDLGGEFFTQVITTDPDDRGIELRKQYNTI